MLKDQMLGWKHMMLKLDAAAAAAETGHDLQT
jgi:hypothetical protein